jgi:very-short-patch-repair endonuclease
MMIPEARLWGCIRRRQLGVRFRRQVPIGPWIVDFACFDPRIVIEVDDLSHDWPDELGRTRYLESLGFTILRYDNRDIIEVDGVLWSIAAAVNALRCGKPLPWD